MTNSQDNSTRNRLSFQKKVAIIGVLLFIGKLIAWNLTNSDAVFSDAMESIVNIISAFMGLYSLYLAAKPRDDDHPYGHGKVEFITSGIEGALIIFAGLMIIIESVDSLLHGNVLKKLDWGMLIIFATALINYLMGYISIKKGEKENSVVLISSGKHLQTDTLTTIGVVLSLVLVYFTKINRIDSLVALLFGLYIIFVGYKIVRKSLSGIMDEADPKFLENLAKLLQEHRKPNWVDVHNTKMQQYGADLHIDAHLTLPWYYPLRKAHDEMEQIIKLIAKNTDRSVEFNFHMDDCKDFSCEICQLADCEFRQRNFVRKVEWNSESISQVSKHALVNSSDNKIGE